MHYRISRNGQTYGPYTLEDLRRYLASGNVLLTDLAKGEEGTDWVPVSEVLGMPAPQSSASASAGNAATAGQTYGQTYAAQPQAGPVYPGQPPGQPDAGPVYASPLSSNAAFAASQFADPPNLNWGLYLLIAILTCGLFSKVFTLVQALWLKKVQPNSTAILFYVALYVLAVFNLFHGFGVWIGMMHNHGVFPMAGGITRGLLQFAYVILLIVTRFVMSASLEEHFNGAEPIGLKLNPVAVFFFGGVYFQYQFNRINALKQAARYGVARTF